MSYPLPQPGSAARILSARIISAAAFASLGTAAWAQSTVEKCDNKLGTIAVIEAKQGYGYLSGYGLGSPSALLRLMIQQSNCFDVVERGAAFQNLQQERALAAGGELQQDSNLGKGQLQAADFVMTPDIQVSGNTGGVGGTVGSIGHLFGGWGATIGALAGSMKFREANTSLLIADVRSGIQVAAAEGKAQKTDFSIGGWGYGGGSWAGGGGYTNTPEGKMIAASLLDNFNAIVAQIRGKNLLIQSRSESSSRNAAASLPATNGPARPAAVAVAAPVAAAPAVAATTPQIVPTHGYTGVYAGPDQGTFAVAIDSNGNIAGSGNSSTYGRFVITGSLDPSGSLTMTSSGLAYGAQYSGVLNRQTGQVKGVWVVPALNRKGTFTGGRM